MTDFPPPIDGMLRPAGAGIHVVSTGVEELLELQERIYGVQGRDAVLAAWQNALGRAGNRISVLGVPSDTGAGFRKGANHGPNGVRSTLLSRQESAYHNDAVVDLGDVFCIPHLLSEEMLNVAQRRRCQQSVYGAVDVPADWPVSPLGLTYAVLSERYRSSQTENTEKPIVIGGDHSVGWPAFKSAFDHWEAGCGERLGLLHFDAHTDLLPSRLGVDYCFATWAYHANELLQRDGRLYQVGIRTSGRTKAHWENTLNVRQLWAEQARATPAKAAAKDVIERFESLGVTKLYISNDIDGVDPFWASATGTPEPDGLHPEWVSELTRRVAEVFPLVGADLVEVAPTLEPLGSDALMRTLDTAADFIEDFFSLMNG
ncbi:MAG: arginase family protein [Bradymonadia bacterium]